MKYLLFILFIIYCNLIFSFNNEKDDSIYFSKSEKEIIFKKLNFDINKRAIVKCERINTPLIGVNVNLKKSEKKIIWTSKSDSNGLCILFKGFSNKSYKSFFLNIISCNSNFNIYEIAPLSTNNINLFDTCNIPIQITYQFTDTSKYILYDFLNNINLKINNLSEKEFYNVNILTPIKNGFFTIKSLKEYKDLCENLSRNGVKLNLMNQNLDDIDYKLKLLVFVTNGKINNLSFNY